jgi:hypothetical protein
MSLKRPEDVSVFKRVSQIVYSQGELQDLFVRLGFTHVPNLSEPTFEQQQDPNFAHDHNALFLLVDVIRSQDVIYRDVMPSTPPAPVATAGQRIYYFSELGDAFVRAYQPPPKA